MIGKITGNLLENTLPTLLLDVHGVAYEVDVPLTVSGALPDIGKPCSFYTHFVVREDAQQLYGFLTRAERELFRLLLKAVMSVVFLVMLQIVNYVLRVLMVVVHDLVFKFGEKIIVCVDFNSFLSLYV